MKKYVLSAALVLTIFFAYQAHAGIFSDKVSDFFSTLVNNTFLAAAVTAQVSSSPVNVTLDKASYLQGEPITVKWSVPGLDPTRAQTIKITLINSASVSYDEVGGQGFITSAVLDKGNSYTFAGTDTFDHPITIHQLGAELHYPERHGPSFNIKVEVTVACTPLEAKSYCGISKGTSEAFPVIPQITKEASQFSGRTKDNSKLNTFFALRGLPRDYVYDGLTNDGLYFYLKEGNYSHEKETFDSITERAVKEYQTKNNIPLEVIKKKRDVRGGDIPSNYVSYPYVGPSTRKKINEELLAGINPSVQVISQGQTIVYKPGDIVTIQFTTNIADSDTRGTRIDLYSAIESDPSMKVGKGTNIAFNRIIDPAVTSGFELVSGSNGLRVKKYTYQWKIPENLLSTDGYYIRAIGAEKRLPGILGLPVFDTSDVMFAIDKRAFATSSVPLIQHPIGPGSTGRDVEILQDFLNKNFYGILDERGNFGGYTANSVVQFKQKLVSYPTANVGEKTMESINTEILNAAGVVTSTPEVKPYIKISMQHMADSRDNWFWRSELYRQGSTVPVEITKNHDGVVTTSLIDAAGHSTVIKIVDYKWQIPPSLPPGQYSIEAKTDRVVAKSTPFPVAKNPYTFVTPKLGQVYRAGDQIKVEWLFAAPATNGGVQVNSRIDRVSLFDQKTNNLVMTLPIKRESPIKNTEGYLVNWWDKGTYESIIPQTIPTGQYYINIQDTNFKTTLNSSVFTINASVPVVTEVVKVSTSTATTTKVAN